MGGSVRMSGIPYHPKDQVPAKHGGDAVSKINENRPPDVTYDKNGIVHPQDQTKSIPNQFVVPDVAKTNYLMPSDQSSTFSKGATVGRPDLSNAKRVSTQTAAEARAAAKARKASAPSPRREYSNDR